METIEPQAKKVNNVEVILPQPHIPVRCGKCHGMAFGVNGDIRNRTNLLITNIRCLRCGNTLEIDKGSIVSAGKIEGK